MNLFNIIHTHPVGTRLRFLDNNEIKEIAGYEWIHNTCNIIFSDGVKLNIHRLELVSRELSA